MTSETRLLLFAFGAVVALVVLIARLKVHPFIALVVVSLTMGVASGMPFAAAIKAFQEGVGTALGFIATVAMTSAAGISRRSPPPRPARAPSCWCWPPAPARSCSRT